MMQLKLEGRIDSTNAAQTEQECVNFCESHTGETIGIDAAKLEYISSAGLRVLLKLKKLYGVTDIQNVSPVVYEILDTTGFTEMLTVHKALREIDITGCEQIGQGFSAKVYRLDSETIVKVYDAKIGIDRVTIEQQNAQKAFLNGVPTAITFDTVRCGDQLGTVYELIDSKQLSRFLYENPDKAEEYEHKYARMMREMHSVTMPSEFQDIKELYRSWLLQLSELLTEEELQRLLTFLELIPNRDTFVHCDCHVGNIMVQNGELVLIDMADVGRGHPVFDLAAEFFHYVILENSLTREFALRTMLGFVPDNRFLPTLWSNLIKGYFGVEDAQEIQEITGMIEAVGRLRTIATVAKQSQMLPEHKQLIIGDTRKTFLANLDVYIARMQKLEKYFG